MLELLKLIITDPVWSGVALSILTAAGGWLWRQLSDDQRARLSTWERFARDAGAWAILHAASGMTITQVQELGREYLGKLCDRLRIPAAVRDHLIEVMNGFIAQELVARGRQPNLVMLNPTPPPAARAG